MTTYISPFNWESLYKYFNYMYSNNFIAFKLCKTLELYFYQVNINKNSNCFNILIIYSKH